MISQKKIKKLKHLILSQIHFREFEALSSNNEILSNIFKTLIQVKNSKFDLQDRNLFTELRQYRNLLLQNNEIITYEIFDSDKTDTVSNVCRKATSPEIWCKLHYLLTKNLNVKNYLEIGTNLGVSGSYILSALKKNDGKFVTMEGVPKLCEISNARFKTLVDENQFQIIQGLYERTFPEMLELPINFDILFLDGNHKFEPTMHYFKKLKDKIKNVGIFIFDDIYLVKEMEKVWSEIQKDKDVNYTIDLYKLGIVIIDKSDKNRNINSQFYLSR